MFTTLHNYFVSSIFTYIHTQAVTFNLIHLCYYVATYSAPMSSHHTNHIQNFMLCFPHDKSNSNSSKAKHETRFLCWIVHHLNIAPPKCSAQWNCTWMGVLAWLNNCRSVLEHHHCLSRGGSEGSMKPSRDSAVPKIYYNLGEPDLTCKAYKHTTRQHNLSTLTVHGLRVVIVLLCLAS